MARSLTKLGFAVGSAIKNLEEPDAPAQSGNGLLKMIGDFFKQSAGEISSAAFSAFRDAKKNNQATS
jgi:hypothetical protein